MNTRNRSAQSLVLSLIILLLIALSGCRSSVGNTAGTPQPGSGNYIQNKGSDTIVNLALAWAEVYQQEHPEVRISVTGGGTGTGIASLFNGTVDIANASRQITEQELQRARSIGFEPVEYVIARDAIAVIVHPDNPVENLTIEQISQIFSGEITNWSEVGGEDRPIIRVSRETNSGTHVYFLEAVIRQGDENDDTIFAAETLLWPSSDGIIAEVSDNPNAIGYDGLGYITPTVKVVGVAENEGGDYVLPSVETVNNGTYPISRDLYMYTHDNPSEGVREYLDWIFSPPAQEIVNELGFVPITP